MDKAEGVGWVQIVVAILGGGALTQVWTIVKDIVTKASGKRRQEVDRMARLLSESEAARKLDAKEAAVKLAESQAETKQAEVFAREAERQTRDAEKRARVAVEWGSANRAAALAAGVDPGSLLKLEY